ncbi:MAG: cell division protein FtsZ, partial [Actinomycetota bacterium]
GLHEIDDAARLVQEAVHPEANIIFGATIEDTLGDEVRITVIAAGFDGGEPTYRKFEAPAMAVAAMEAVASSATEQPLEVQEYAAEVADVALPSSSELLEQELVSARPQQGTGSFGDDLDLPEFFR